MKKYDHSKIEKKWQKYWEVKKMYRASDKLASVKDSKKFYTLVEFPFPSGAGLHTGHTRSYTAMDVISRKKRATGHNVLFPIGWDAFGLPTENYAIKTGIPPQKATKQNTDTFRRQLKAVGISFDWTREVNTTDPEYYKWTQWIFLQMYKNDLAYKKKMTINWCPKDKTGLANEEVVNGCCERCGTVVEKREKEQWMLAITKYADRLDKDLDTVDYLEKIKIQQRNWIGRSEGAELSFNIKDSSESINVFTTRIDTLCGVTYLVLAPDHELLKKLQDRIKNYADIEKYAFESSKKEEFERTNDEKEKTGVEILGVKALHPITKQEVPVWISDYVLSSYGTGAVMAVPAHDSRDYAFAKKFNIDIKQVIQSENIIPFLEKGVLMSSGEFNGLTSEKAKIAIGKKVNAKVITKYKLRDWIFSRQRYWGEPIPMINCASCGIQPVPEKDLPVKLPPVKKYEPTDNGESPLASITAWVNTTCPKCKGKAKRETDTMPNWAGSSWYFLRYIDPKNKKAFADKDKIKDWMMVDWYNGGMEHTTLHLLYSRFWHKFLYDIGAVNTIEPYAKRTSHGLILAEGGEKMSKSKGNVVSPDDLVKLYGADTLRVYQLFMGPFEQAIAWDTKNMIGSRRFIERTYTLINKIDGNTKNKTLSSNPELESLIHKTIKKVGEDIDSLGFNTAISSLMILLNAFEKEESISNSAYEIFLKLLAPFAPHITDELWSILGKKKSIHLESWPEYDKKKLVSTTFKIVVQINSRVRAMFETPTNIEADVVKTALELPEIKSKLGDLKPVKVVYVKGKLVNLVVPGL